MRRRAHVSRAVSALRYFVRDIALPSFLLQRHDATACCLTFRHRCSILHISNECSPMVPTPSSIFIRVVIRRQARNIIPFTEATGFTLAASEYDERLLFFSFHTTRHREYTGRLAGEHRTLVTAMFPDGARIREPYGLFAHAMLDIHQPEKIIALLAGTIPCYTIRQQVSCRPTPQQRRHVNKDWYA